MGMNLRFKKIDIDQPLFLKRKRGQSLIEAAAVIPILILFLVLVFDIGRMVFTKIVVTNAAREGAYFISYNPDTNLAELTAVVSNEAQNSGVITPLTITPSCLPCSIGGSVSVSVETTINGVMYSDMVIIGNSVEMAVMK